MNTARLLNFFKLFSTAHATPVTYSLLGRGGQKNDNIFPLTDRAIGIGTDPKTCAIIYSAGTAGISAFHCQLVPQNGGWTITDFSDSGTWLNGAKINKFQAYPLNVGDVFYLASLENSFFLQSEAVTTPQPQPPSQSIWKILKERYFTWKGRLNRKPYILRELSLLLPVIIFCVILIELDKIPSDDLSTAMTILAFLMVGLMLVMCVSGYMLTIRRLHDMDHSGWWVLVYPLTPIIVGISKLEILNLVSLALGLYLFFRRGTSGSNRFGPDPLA